MNVNEETNCYPQAIASLLDLADGITPAKRECKTEIAHDCTVFLRALQWMALRYLCELMVSVKLFVNLEASVSVEHCSAKEFQHV